MIFNFFKSYSEKDIIEAVSLVKTGELKNLLGAIIRC